LRRAWPILVLALAAVLLLVPAPSPGRVERAAQDLAHVPLGAALACALRSTLRGRRRSPWTDAQALVGSIALLAALEGFQGLVGRSSSWSDWLAGASGAAGALLAVAAWRASRGSLAVGRAALGLVAFVVPSVSPAGEILDARRQANEMPVLASFERALEMGRWEFGASRGERARAHATHATWSLRVDLAPEAYPRASLVWPAPDWRGHDALAFEVFLEGPDPLDLVLKVADADHDGSYHDRFHRTLSLRPGPNAVRVPLEAIASAPRTRRLDLGRVAHVALFAERLDRPRTFFLDHVRLEGTEPPPGTPAGR
jgi:hypothetical protein